MSSIRNSRHAAFFSNTAWQYLLQLVKYILPLVTLPYLARVLKPEGYALFAYVTAVMTYAQVVVEFGFNLSGTKRIAHASSTTSASTVIGEITAARLILAVGTYVPLIAFASIAPITRDYLLYTSLSYVAVCGRVFAPDFVFQGKEKMGPLTTRYLASKGASTALTFLLVHSADDLLWIPVLDIFASIIALIWSYGAMHRIFGYGISRPSLANIVSEIRSSTIYCFSNVAAVTLTGFTTIVVGIALTDRAQLSYWSLAMTAVTAVQAMYTPIINSLFPHMVVSRDYHFARTISAYSVPIISILTIAFAASSRLIMRVLGGAAYTEGATVLLFVAPLLPFSFYATLFGWPILGSTGHVRELTWTTVASACFCIACLSGLIFFQSVSLIAVCIVRVLSEVVLFTSRALLVGQLRRSLRSSHGDEKA